MGAAFLVFLDRYDGSDRNAGHTSLPNSHRQAVGASHGPTCRNLHLKNLNVHWQIHLIEIVLATGVAAVWGLSFVIIDIANRVCVELFGFETFSSANI